jgi:hypothetical protein
MHYAKVSPFKSAIMVQLMGRLAQAGMLPASDSPDSAGESLTSASRQPSCASFAAYHEICCLFMHYPAPYQILVVVDEYMRHPRWQSYPRPTLSPSVGIDERWETLSTSLEADISEQPQSLKAGSLHAFQMKVPRLTTASPLTPIFHRRKNCI